MSRQLALPIALKEDLTLERFIAGQNQQVIADARSCAEGDGERFVYLWGARSTGKSHLLQALVQAVSSTDIPAAYIPLDQPDQLDPSVLDGMETFQLVCLDNIHSISGQQEWELALFNLFNRLQAHNHRLITSADQPPSRLPIQLKDLSSRLTWGLTHQIQPLNDSEKRLCLIADAKRRGLTMSEETAAYIMRHYPRDMGTLRHLLDQLDIASLEDKRRLTIPFIKQRLDADKEG